MTFRKFVLLTLVLSICFVAKAEENRRDGNWWRTLDNSSHNNYVTGFFDGMDLGHNFSYWGYWGTEEERADQKNIDAVNKASDSYNKLLNKYFKNVTNDQIADGLNMFYEDYKNRNIRIHSAVWLVVQQVSGKSKEEMEKMIESWRKNAN